MKIISTINRLLDVPSADPDDARRRKLLNILLVGITITVLLGLLLTTPLILTGLVSQQEGAWLYPSSLMALTGLALIFGVNRYWSGVIASSLFIVLLLAVIASTDEPQHVVEGRSLFMLAIPIMMASVLLRPYAGFIVAGLTGLLLFFVATNARLDATAIGAIPFTTLGFMALALVAWLAARSLEQALKDLRTLNLELEQRVADRTRDLADALAREQIELSKSQAILEGIADGVIVFDRDGRAIVANPAIASLLVRPPQTILGHDIASLMGNNVHPADQQTLINLLQEATTRRSGLKFQWGDKTLSASFAPVRTATGQVTGTVAVFRDFTREAEIDRMKSAIVSMVSHDLRTPLSAIMGYAEMLQEAVYGPLTEKQSATMERIIANTKRLLSLVNDLLDQAQIEAGRLTLKNTPFAVSELLDGVKSIMSVLAQNKGLALLTAIDENVPATLVGDPQRLHQILINLTGNALKFTEQGHVEIRIYRPNATHWAIQVSDTGPGIPPDKLDQVFERFYQIDHSATRKHGGVGLGLSIVKQLVTLMGGQVAVTSRLAHGSTFTVYLPLLEAQPSISPTIQESTS